MNESENKVVLWSYLLTELDPIFKKYGVERVVFGDRAKTYLLKLAIMPGYRNSWPNEVPL